jgi:triphosphoribosyl-dephospho-CoA synthase
MPEDELVITVLLGAMAACDDTCLVARGGMESLAGARSLAERILDSGGPGSPAGAALYAGMVAEFSGKRLSPGGSADLCAAALFLADAETAEKRAEVKRRACLAPA